MTTTWLLIVFLRAGNAGGSQVIGNFFSLQSCSAAAKEIKADMGAIYEAHSCVQVNR
jgi:hypothetical protein